MPDEQKKWQFGHHLWAVYGLSIGLVAIIWYYQWILGMIMILALAASFYYSWRTEWNLYQEKEKYIASLSYRIKKVGEEAFLEMPIGIILFDDDYYIEWSNPYMNQFSAEDTWVGQSLNLLDDHLIPAIKENKEETRIHMNGYVFQTIIKKDERLLYLFDRTKQSELEMRYQNEQTVLAIIFLDNYDEITQNMEDARKTQLNSRVTAVLNQWSQEHGLYLKRMSQERFLAVGTNQILTELEGNKFAILDDVRELQTDQNLPLTISIGIGYGHNELPVLGELAQSSLDLALGRGGDQVAIKDETGKVRFYGGKTNPMEKRTRVRARVISHALKELVKASDNVLIMGHQAPDMDAIGSAIGILNIAKANDVEGYIVFDPEDVDISVKRLIETIRQDDELWARFVEPEEADELITNRSLIVVVDAHKPSMLIHPRLLNKTDFKVVIDHHRRGEDFVDNPTLVYMEPYASSTAELVTELLEYQPETLKLKMLEATALLAGIIVDTKSFTLRTGSRTFDAASYLRSKGADTILVQQFMKEDMDIYIKRSKLIEKTEIYKDVLAIATADDGDVFSPVLIAQTADTLLSMTGVEASFVISERKDGKIGVSARSLGKINVQVIMEKMHGGGHLTNAATQIENTTVHDAKAWLKDILDDYYEGGETE